MTTLVLDGAHLADGLPIRIVVDGSQITAITEASSKREMPTGARLLDASGLIASPGFIDLQVNGAAGHDITSDPSAMWEIGEALARHGVTSFLATIVSSPPGVVDAALDAWRTAPAARGAVPIGLHLEGPFLALSRAGAHNPENLRLPDQEESAGWSRAAGARIVTLAPELPGALDLVKGLSARGVLVAIGHTDADAATGRAAVDAGARYGTHLLNAMPKLDGLAPGLAAALLADDRVTIGLIADGIHVAPEMLDTVRRTAGPGRLSLVSDAIAGLDLPPGRVRLGDVDVVVGPEGARLADGRLAGAIAGLDVGLRTLVAATGCERAEAVAAVTSTPATLLGLDDGRGRLEVGGRADITLLTPELDVAATFVAGELAWGADPSRWGG